MDASTAQQDVGFYRRLTSDFASDDTLPGKGLDVGTTHVVGVARDAQGNRRHNAQRHAFIEVRNDAFTDRLLGKLGIHRHTLDGHACVLGDPAFVLANVFEKEAVQPMKTGMVNPGDPRALAAISQIVLQVLGAPKVAGEHCTVTMPADPLTDGQGHHGADNVIYHRGAILDVLRKLGYSPTALCQADAVGFRELAASKHTGIVVCCGGGMFNVSVIYKSIPAVRFSVPRGGDWVDANVASVIGIPSSQACALKEAMTDLSAPRDRAEQAVAIYCQSLVRSTIETIREKFSRADDAPSFVNPVPLVCCGGLAQAHGFLDLFRRELMEVDFPVPISEVRLAADPTFAAADGCLSASEVVADIPAE